MYIGMAGLGRMGLNMARRLQKKGQRVAGFDRSTEALRELKAAGGLPCATLEALVETLRKKAGKAGIVVWLMLPAGEITEGCLRELKRLLKKGDLIVDGGNSLYMDDLRRAEELAALGIGYMDVGVSGGIWGLKEGYCLMAGGSKADYKRLLPALKALSEPGGTLHVGEVGSGHFVKMIHNGIEYGMMSAYGEGFELIRASRYGKGADLAALAGLWNQGSVVRSWLLELLEAALKEDPELGSLEGYVEDSGEGRWTVHAAIDSAVPAPVITAALFQRFTSRGKGEFSNKVLAALRLKFGGHAVKKKASPPKKAPKKAKPKGGKG